MCVDLCAWAHECTSCRSAYGDTCQWFYVVLRPQNREPTICDGAGVSNLFLWLSLYLFVEISNTFTRRMLLSSCIHKHTSMISINISRQAWPWVLLEISMLGYFWLVVKKFMQYYWLQFLRQPITLHVFWFSTPKKHIALDTVRRFRKNWVSKRFYPRVLKTVLRIHW